MPPEAFEGRSDARGDVYSLGLTLYELLAMRPAFDEKDRNKLIKQVTTGEPPALDKVRRAIPRDLVTIVHKAIERDPARRYATAEDLAADLQRFMDDEPIQARRQTQLERYWRWARHNPGIATLGGVLTAVLVLATIASLIVAGRMSNLAQKETQAAADERIARKQAVEAREREADQREHAEQATKAADISRLQTEEALKKARQAEEEAKAEGKRADDQAEFAQRNLFHAQMHLAQQAWREHRGLGHMRELLDSWLPKGETLDRRGWEWFYLNSLPYQNVRTFTESGKAGRPCTVAWHVASKRLAEGTAEGLIRIWDVDREQASLTLTGPASTRAFWGIRWLAWSPDGNTLAAGFPDTTVHVWEVPTGKELHVLRDHKSAITAVAYSSDGKRLAAWGQNGKINIWDADTGKLTDEVAHPGNVSAGAWSPDDKLLATGHGNGTVTISGVQAGDKKVTLRGHVDGIYHLVWSPDGARLVSTAGDFTIRIWDVASEKTVVGPMRHSHGVSSAAWEPDGKRLATGSFDETIKIWDTTTGREALTLRGHVQTVISLAWGPGGRLVSGGNDGSMKIWTAIRDQESSPLPAHFWGTTPIRVTSVAWSPDGKRLASGGDDGRIRIWDSATRQEVLAINAHDERRVYPQFGLIRSLAWSPDSTQLASAGLDGATKVWDAVDGRKIFALPADRGYVWSVAWSPDGTKVAAGSEDGSIRVIEGLKDAPKVQSFKAHDRRARGLAWNNKGDRLASVGADGFVKVWDPVGGVEVSRKHGVPGWIMGVAWSPDDKQLATAHADRHVFVWDAESDKKLATMRGHNDFVDAVVWSPDGKRLASAGIDNSVRIWEPRTGEETFVLRGTSGMFHDVSWHPDGAQIAAVGSDGQIWIWDATPGFERDTTARALPYIERKFAANPGNNAERLRVAQLAFDHKRFAVAARLWAEALASDPKLGDDRQAHHRYNAARAACQAAAGQGSDEPPLDDAAKTKLRGQALDWLKAELTVYGKLFESSTPQEQEVIVMSVNAWKYERSLFSIRDSSALTKLPAVEQKAFTQLWADVAALLKAGNAKHHAFLQDELIKARNALSQDSGELAYLLAQVGRTLLEQEKWVEAEQVLRECLSIREKALPDSWLTFNTYTSLGGSLLGQKKYADAEPLLLKGYQGMKEREKTIPPIGKDRLPEALERLVQLYEATGKKDEAEKWRGAASPSSGRSPRRNRDPSTQLSFARSTNRDYRPEIHTWDVGTSRAPSQRSINVPNSRRRQSGSVDATDCNRLQLGKKILGVRRRSR